MIDDVLRLASGGWERHSYSLELMSNLFTLENCQAATGKSHNHSKRAETLAAEPFVRRFRPLQVNTTRTLFTANKKMLEILELCQSYAAFASTSLLEIHTHTHIRAHTRTKRNSALLSFNEAIDFTSRDEVGGSA